MSTSYISYPYSPPRPRSRLELLLAALALGTGAFLLFAVAAYLFFQLLFLGRIFPGVSVSGIPVGGLSPSAAAIKITQNFQYPLQGRIILQDGEKTWLAAPAQLGFYLDPEGSAEAAFQYGRSSTFFENLLLQVSTLFRGSSVAPRTIFDQRIAHLYLSNLARQVDIPAVEASLHLNGTDVQVEPGKIGRQLDINTNLALIGMQLQTLQDGIIPLKIDETRPAILDASAQAELARQILSQPLTLTLARGESDKGPWEIKPEKLAEMLTFERVSADGASTYQVALKKDRLVEYLSKLAPELLRYPENARFIFNDDTRKLDLIQPAVIGRTLDIQASISSINKKLAAGEHSIPLEFLFTDPPVKDDATAEQLQIRELVGSHTTYFRGSSAERVQNIRTAASRFHGVLVAPGETFSMANQLGNISLDNGYAEALIIFGDQTIKGVGGGVCQVSTTLFRAVFFTGFPIVERHAHAYRVSYYEQVANGRNENFAGLDATVFVPLVDFRFTNDTPYWLLMEVYVVPSNSSITWKFYSTSDGRTVEWKTTGLTNVTKPPEPQFKENPKLAANEIKQIEWSADGAQVTVSRRVLRNGSLYFEDSFYTNYQPWRAVYEYGPETDPKLLDELKK